MAAMASSRTLPLTMSSLMALLVATVASTLVRGAEARPFLPNNITVVGSVYCDACSNNTFSKHSFFLKGARVLVQCSFKANSTLSEMISLEAERMTDSHGVYKLDVPPVEGFECREGRELRSSCRATLLRSSSSACAVPGLRGSSQHIALRGRTRNGAASCFLNLNALNFRPAKRDATLCRGSGSGSGGFGESLFFWPLMPLLWPPFRGLPFPVPEWLAPFLRPPFLPFPLYQPAAAPPPLFPPSQAAASGPEKKASQDKRF